jgi:catechol 2,3-dioxygenase-like lactoylglutathione lyase family enzyme
MLTTLDAMATIPVRDKNVASRFYEKTLGFKRVGGMPEVLVYESGRSKIVVYESPYAGTNQATTATWAAGPNVEKVVEELKAKGVRFEHYDLPGLTLKGDVHVAGDFKGAWFKDPDGNILHIVSG